MESTMEKVIGYTQGTYDMFHIGHLNLIKNAKRHCDYLIVGVNADDLLESYKHNRPIVPLNERVEIVRAIKYGKKPAKRWNSWEQSWYFFLTQKIHHQPCFVRN